MTLLPTTSSSPKLQLEDVDSTLHPLPEMRPQFFIPRLEDKPQNPIMHTLRLMNDRDYTQPLLPLRMAYLPPEIALISQDVLDVVVQEKNIGSIWNLAGSHRHRCLNQLLSWDALRPSFMTNTIHSPSSFLSEQRRETFASARYHLRPPVQDSEVRLLYVHVPELYQSLLLTVSGTSSPLHIWDSARQTFCLRNLKGRERGKIVIVGKDEVVSRSLLERFLNIGNLLRRLELLADNRETSRITPVTHAFMHALSSTLAYLRQKAEGFAQAVPGADARLTAFWTQYEDIEDILRALAALCGREEHVDPSDYTPLPTTPTHLLSLIYQHLSEHLERASPRIVSAALAFVLTTTSRGYFRGLCASVGYNTPSSRVGAIFSATHPGQSERPHMGALEDDNDDGRVRTEEDDPTAETTDFPDFITPKVGEVFSRARKSLVLLRAADPGHPLLTSNHVHPEIEWIWTEEQLENMADQISLSGPPAHTQTSGTRGRVNAVISSASATDVMSAFKIFCLVPGESTPNTDTTSESVATNLSTGAHSTSPLRTFLATFQSSLPSSTPTLAHLTARVLAPLIAHAQALSGALVAHFLAPTAPLHLHTHLVLLRGYLLVTAHTFKARLQDALFADSENVSAVVVGSRTYAAKEAQKEARERARSKGGKSRSRDSFTGGLHEKKMAQGGRRAIGLSPALTMGEKWPPLGSDLNFLLRTVVVDALEQERNTGAESEHDAREDEVRRTQKHIVEEAGWRLGFAIRDLPVGTGRDKWLNPLSIEALDFLYMQYQPPYPLDVLITPVVLSKYHRMFAFNLRLMRVESVVRTLFRLTRKTTAPLFPTLTPSNKLLLHFRYVVHTFIMALSSYIYDVAIGSNMDAFLARLDAAAPSAASVSRDSRLFVSTDHTPATKLAAFADVFSLADYHSKVLDDILSSCLLRSGQKAIGDVLRGCMELVLELGVLAGELKDGNLEEYEASPMLEDLWGRFRAKMTTFVKVLMALVEKEADSTGLVLSDIPLHTIHGHKRVSGTTANLHQLLLRLNMSDWWTKRDTPPPRSL